MDHPTTAVALTFPHPQIFAYSCPAPVFQSVGQFKAEVLAHMPENRAMLEVNITKYDSAIDRPISGDFMTSYILVDRITKRKIPGNTNIRIYFREKNNLYQWAQLKNRFSSEYEYKDTIHIEPHQWYQLSCEHYFFQTFFYWNGKNGDYAIRYVPDPGAY